MNLTLDAANGIGFTENDPHRVPSRRWVGHNFAFFLCFLLFESSLLKEQVCEFVWSERLKATKIVLPETITTEIFLLRVFSFFKFVFHFSLQLFFRFSFWVTSSSRDVVPPRETTLCRVKMPQWFYIPYHDSAFYSIHGPGRFNCIFRINTISFCAALINHTPVMWTVCESIIAKNGRIPSRVHHS